MAGFWMPYMHAAEIQHVQFGSTVTLGCNISYLYHTTWLKHNPDLTPTVVLCAGLREGQPFQGRHDCTCWSNVLDVYKSHFYS